MIFRWKGILFHNFGPWIANEQSNRDWSAAEPFFREGGIIARFPNLGRATNCLFCRIFPV